MPSPWIRGNGILPIGSTKRTFTNEPGGSLDDDEESLDEEEESPDDAALAAFSCVPPEDAFDVDPAAPAPSL